MRYSQQYQSRTMVSALLTSFCMRRGSVLQFTLICGAVFLGMELRLTAANPILFVTQVPVPNEVNDNVVTNVFLGVGAGFGNHLSSTLYAPRGGDLWLGKPNPALTNLILTNLTRSLGFGLAGAQHTNGIAVREPCIHWTGKRALFS